MHIIIAVLTAIAGVIWALYRLQNSGVDLNAFNPFYWLRRRAWETKPGIKPLHRLEKPLEAAAVLVVAALNTEGEVSREQKAEVIASFESEFNLSSNEAADLFSSSSFLLRGTLDFTAEVKHILAPTLERFTDEQIESVVSLVKRASLLDGVISSAQHELMSAITNEFSPRS